MRATGAYETITQWLPDLKSWKLDIEIVSSCGVADPSRESIVLEHCVHGSKNWLLKDTIDPLRHASEFILLLRGGKHEDLCCTSAAQTMPDQPARAGDVDIFMGVHCCLLLFSFFVRQLASL